MPETGLDLVARSFAQWIYHQDNEERIKRYEKYEDYYQGDFDVHLTPKVQEALGSDFAVIASYPKTIVNKAVGYLCGKPLTIKVNPDLYEIEDIEDEEERAARKAERLKEAKNIERFLYNVYRANQFLKQNMIKLIRIQGKKGDVFVKVFLDYEDKDNPIKLRVLTPNIVYPKYKDDDIQTLEYVAIIVNRIDENGRPYKYAQVFWEDVIVEYKQGMGEETWQEIDRHPNEIGMIPIVHIKNTEDDKLWGESDIEPIMTLVDAICKALTDMTVNADYQSFQRVFTTGQNDGYAQGDKATEEANRKQEVGPGVRTNLPDPEANVYVVEPVNPQGLIEIIKTLREEISFHSRVPQIALGKADGTGAVSSLALRIHYQPLHDKCDEKEVLAANGLQQVNRIIFAYHKLLTGEDFTGYDTEIDFVTSMPVDRLEEQTIRTQRIANKTLSRGTAMEEEGIEDPESELEKIRAERDLEQDVYGGRVEDEIERLLGGGESPTGRGGGGGQGQGAQGGNQ